MCAFESASEFRRRRAVELMLLGESKETISRIFGVSRNSLNVWLRKKEAGESLKTKPGSGRPRRLNEQQLKELEEALKKGPVAHGWENNLWTTRRVREVIKRCFDIEFTRSGVWHVLQDYLHWSAIKPARQMAKRDESEIARWKAEEFPRIEQRTKERGAHLVFIDESGFMMMPTIRRTFAPRGTTPVNKGFDPHGRISVSGAITVSPKRTRICLHYYMLADNTNFRGPSVVAFLKQLATFFASGARNAVGISDNRGNMPILPRTLRGFIYEICAICGLPGKRSSGATSWFSSAKASAGPGSTSE